MEDELENEKLIFNKYIEDKGFHFKFNNNHYKEEYDIEIEIINKTNYSSDSSSGSDSSENDNSILIDDFLFMNNNSKKNSLEKNNSKDRKIKIENKRNKKNSYPSDGKSSLFNEKKRKSRNITLTDDEENKNAKINLINNLVEIKEKYNKLINEKYELEYQMKKMEKKLKTIKTKIFKIKNSSLNNT